MAMAGSSAGAIPRPMHMGVGDPPPVGVDVHVRPSTAQLESDAQRAASNRAVRLGLTQGVGSSTVGQRVTGIVTPAAAAGSGPRVATPADVTIPPGTPANPNLTEHVGTSCTGTGTDGKRVQVMYANTADQPSRYGQVRTLVQSYAADVDDTLALSAAKTGGNLRVRWVTDSDCSINVLDVELPSGSLDSISATANALSAAGYNDPNRKYLVFADAAVYCGISEAYQDDSATNNINDTQAYGPLVSRVDSACWNSPQTHSVPAHELMHNLGAVMNTAPDATPGMHCTDASDVMCYVDGAGVVLRQICPQEDERLYDCSGNDYFNTNPAPGSYLATHWNTARSSWLDTVLPAGQTYPPTVTGPTSITPGLPITVTATLPAQAAAGTRLTWPVPEPATCRVLPVSSTATTSTATISCPAELGVSSVTVHAATISPLGGVGAGSLTSTVSTTTKPLTVALAASTTTPRADQPVRLGIAVASGQVSVRAGVSVWARPVGSSGGWTRVRARLDTEFGAVTVTVNPTVATVYQVSVAADPSWTVNSPSVTITPE
jgi:hypothetical protein